MSEGLPAVNLGATLRRAAAATTPAELLDIIIDVFPVVGAQLVDLVPITPRVVAEAGKGGADGEHFPLPNIPERVTIRWAHRVDDLDLIQGLVAMIDSNRQRQRVAEQLHEVQVRSDLAQSLAHMGDYVWDIVGDTVTWSDELYRIYGLEPQSVKMTYDRFISMIHPDDRERIRGIHERAYATCEPYRMVERIVRPDGDVRVLDSHGTVETDEDGNPVAMRGSCVDVTAKTRAEQALRGAIDEVVDLDVRLAQARTRRRQALEINDNIIQGLTAGLMALEAGREDAASMYLQRTLQASRDMMRDLLVSLDPGEFDPEDLVRDDPAPRLGNAPVAPPTTPPREGDGRIRVLLVDDAEDVRVLLRVLIEEDDRFAVVGEADNGEAGVEMAATLRPDLVLMDVAMPVMDGLAATPLIRKAVPEAKVIVLSGFASSEMAQRSLEAGAIAYVEKGDAMSDVRALLLSHVTP